jgi:ribose transport system ATP-binding protein
MAPIAFWSAVHGLSTLLLDGPLAGDMAAAKSDVHRTMRALADRGKAIVMVSDDLSELLATCDRIAVMHRGVLGKVRPAAEWTPASLLAEAVGAVA